MSDFFIFYIKRVSNSFSVYGNYDGIEYLINLPYVKVILNFCLLPFYFCLSAYVWFKLK
jgi:hypothetical protein